MVDRQYKHNSLQNH